MLLRLEYGKYKKHNNAQFLAPERQDMSNMINITNIENTQDMVLGNEMDGFAAKRRWKCFRNVLERHARNKMDG